jgi:ABC-type transport system involved in multi-copper enzyme maturation permease subunit
MTGLRNAFASEWLKLRRRTFLLGTLGGIIAVEVLVTVLIFATARTHLSSSGPGGPGGSTTLAQLASANGMTLSLGQSVTLLGVVALCVAAAQLASEYTQGTLRILLVRQPNRLVLLGGKCLGIFSFVALSVVAATITSIVMSFVMAGVRGIATDSWLSIEGASAAATSFGNVLLAVIGYAAIGIFLAALFRSPVIAIAIGIAYLLPVDAIIAGTVSGTSKYLPGQILRSIAQGGTSSVSYRWGIVAGLVLLGALGLFSARTFSRRDVTS